VLRVLLLISIYATSIAVTFLKLRFKYNRRRSLKGGGRGWRSRQASYNFWTRYNRSYNNYGYEDLGEEDDSTDNSVYNNNRTNNNQNNNNSNAQSINGSLPNNSHNPQIIANANVDNNNTEANPSCAISIPPVVVESTNQQINNQPEQQQNVIVQNGNEQPDDEPIDIDLPNEIDEIMTEDNYIESTVNSINSTTDQTRLINPVIRVRQAQAQDAIEEEQDEFEEYEPNGDRDLMLPTISDTGFVTFVSDLDYNSIEPLYTVTTLQAKTNHTQNIASNFQAIFTALFLNVNMIINTYTSNNAIVFVFNRKPIRAISYNVKSGIYIIHTYLNARPYISIKTVNLPVFTFDYNDNNEPLIVDGKNKTFLVAAIRDQKIESIIYDSYVGHLTRVNSGFNAVTSNGLCCYISMAINDGEYALPFTLPYLAFNPQDDLLGDLTDYYDTVEPYLFKCHQCCPINKTSYVIYPGHFDVVYYGPLKPLSCLQTVLSRQNFPTDGLDDFKKYIKYLRDNFQRPNNKFKVIGNVPATNTCNNQCVHNNPVNEYLRNCGLNLIYIPHHQPQQQQDKKIKRHMSKNNNDNNKQETNPTPIDTNSKVQPTPVLKVTELIEDNSSYRFSNLSDSNAFNKIINNTDSSLLVNNLNNFKHDVIRQINSNNCLRNKCKCNKQIIINFFKKIKSYCSTAYIHTRIAIFALLSLKLQLVEKIKKRIVHVEPTINHEPTPIYRPLLRNANGIDIHNQLGIFQSEVDDYMLKYNRTEIQRNENPNYQDTYKSDDTYYNIISNKLKMANHNAFRCNMKVFQNVTSGDTNDYSIIIQDTLYYHDFSEAIIKDMTLNPNVNTAYITVLKFNDNVGTYVYPSEYSKMKPEVQTDIFDELGQRYISMTADGNTPYKHLYPVLFNTKLVKNVVFNATFEVSPSLTIVAQELTKHTIDLEHCEATIIRIYAVRNKVFHENQQQIHPITGIHYSNNNYRLDKLRVTARFKEHYPRTYNNLLEQFNAIDLTRKVPFESLDKTTFVEFVNNTNNHHMHAEVRRYLRLCIDAYTSNTNRIYIAGHNEVSGNRVYTHTQKPLLSPEDYNRVYSRSGCIECSHVVEDTTICPCLKQRGLKTKKYYLPLYKIYAIQFINWITNCNDTAFNIQQTPINTIFNGCNINPVIVNDLMYHTSTFEEFSEHYNKICVTRINNNNVRPIHNDFLLSSTKLRKLYAAVKWYDQYLKIESVRSFGFTTNNYKMVQHLLNDIYHYEIMGFFSKPAIIFLTINIPIFILQPTSYFTQIINIISSLLAFNGINEFLILTFIAFMYYYAYSTANSTLKSFALEMLFISVGHMQGPYYFYIYTLYLFYMHRQTSVKMMCMHFFYHYFLARLFVIASPTTPEIIDMAGSTFITKHCITESALNAIKNFFKNPPGKHTSHVSHFYKDGIKVCPSKAQCNNQKIETGAKFIIDFSKYPILDKFKEYLSSIYHSCNLTSLHPIVTRQLKSDLVQPKQTVYQFAHHYSSLLFDKFKQHYDGIFSYSYVDYYNHLTTAQKKEMDDYHQLLATEGIFKTSNLAVYNVFKKSGEKLVNKPGDESKVRNISGSPSGLKYVIGPFIYAIQKAMYTFDPAHDQPGSDMQLSRSLNNSIKLMRAGKKIAIEIDGKSFDSTQWKSIIFGLDVNFYLNILSITAKSCLHVSESIMRVCLQSVDIIGYSPLLGYTTYGTVASGRSNTTLGNTQRSAFYVRYIASQARLIEGVDYILRCTGDDILIIIHIDSVQSFVNHSNYTYGTGDNSLCQVAKKLKIVEIEHATYLSMRICLINGEYFFIKDPARTYANSFLSTKITPTTSARVERNIKQCIKLSLLCTTSMYPVIKDMIQNIDTTGIRQDYFDNWLRSRANKDRDFRHTARIIEDEDNIVNHINSSKTNRLHFEIWLANLYGITSTKDSTIDTIYKYYNPTENLYEYEMHDQTSNNIQQIKHNFSLFFEDFKMKNKFSDIKHQLFYDSIVTSYTFKRVVPIFANQPESYGDDLYNYNYQRLFQFNKTFMKNSINIINRLNRNYKITHHCYQ